MKTPGIFYRISFLVILNSLFIFAIVTFVSIENNEAKIDKLVGYKFDIISTYFRNELDVLAGVDLHNPPQRAVNQDVIDRLVDHSRRFMKGLAGVSFLVPADNGESYHSAANAFISSLDNLSGMDRQHIASDANRSLIDSKGIHVGERQTTEAGILKTIYVPWKPKNNDMVLAITFLPDTITGGDSHYNENLTLLFLFITLITLLIINLLFRKFIRPLKHLMQGMEKTTTGEVMYTIEDITDDELGQVAQTFNTMSQSLWKKRRQLTESNESLRVLNQKLTDTLNELADANASLSESEALLSKLIKNAPFGVIATNANGKIIIFSQAALEMFAIEPQKALVSDLKEFFPFATDKIFPEPGEEQVVLEEEMICCKVDGDSFPAFVSRVPIWEKPGVIRAYLFILRDISESKGFREMMISIDRMATRGVMAGEVAHEINNYLAVILGNVELLPLLLSRGQMEKVDKKLEVLKKSVSRIQRFAEGLMGYGGEDAVIQPGDLNQNIENLVAFVKPQNRYDGITFNLDLSPRLALVDFDSSQMQQLLVNLFNNAADALHEIEGERHIDVATAMLEDGTTVRISIKDNGGGLPEDLENVIFRERYLGRRRGRGFGLVIVKQILDKHHGSIGFESSPNGGTEFIITLPSRYTAVEEGSGASVGGQVMS